MHRELPFLHCLDAAAQEHLRSLAVPRRYEADAALFRAGDRSDHVLIVTSGRVKIATFRPGAGEVVLAERGAGDLLGELSAIDGQPRSADAVAVDEVGALAVLKDDFVEFLRVRPGAAVALLETLAQRLRSADRRQVEFGETDGVTRVARGLKELAAQDGQPAGPWVLVARTPLELAAHLQTSEDEVVNALAVLQGDGIVESHRGGVTIIDADALGTRAD